MNLTPESRAALHDLLDISLNGDKSTATVMFNVSAHCDVIAVDVHKGGWVPDRAPSLNVWISPDLNPDEPQKALSEIRAYLETCKPISEEEKRAARIAKLRVQLEKAEKEGVTA